jgi:serine/threonine protein kinase
MRLSIVTATRLKEEEDSKRAAAQQRQTSSSFSSAAAVQRASTSTTVSVSSRYQLSSTVLGKGHFARVLLATDTVTGLQVAVKSIDKKEMVKNRAIVEAELSILSRLGRHRHVVSMLDYYEDERRFYIVMECCHGGDLFSKIVQQGKYTELQAVRCCRQIAEALQYIHSCGITHRDLKPENILLLDDGLEADIKLADFGLSKILNGVNDVMRTVCGTWAYCAPEVISHQSYTSRVDNWTLGVLMFILLCGYHPFDCYGDLPEPELLDKIMRVEYEFDDPVWEDVSAEAKQLIRRLLVYQPEQRMGLQDFLASSWITQQASKGSGVELRAVSQRLGKLSRPTFRALVSAKVAIKKFRASISRSPRTPQSTGKLLPSVLRERSATVEEKSTDSEREEETTPISARQRAAGAGGRQSGSLSGLSFLTGRLDRKEGEKERERDKGEKEKDKEKEKGGLGRGMRISEEKDADDDSSDDGEHSQTGE